MIHTKLENVCLPRIVIESELRALAVMNVNVNNQNSENKTSQ